MATLFEDMAIGNLVARNRIVRAATAESLATADGGVTPRLLEMYRALAEGGAGTIITGYAYVLPDGKPSENAMGIYDDALLDGYRDLTEQVHDAGAKIVMQLVYGGSKSKLASDDARWVVSLDANGSAVSEASGALAPNRQEMAGRGTQVQDAKVTARNTCGAANETSSDVPAAPIPNVRILGPSAVEHPRTHLIPTEATPNDLARVVRAFGQAAARAHACGFDGVEVHAAHGYLLSQFLDGRFNRRTDSYGGTLLNRARLVRECVAAVRAAVTDGFPVFAKINSCDNLQDPIGTHGGLSEGESARVASLLVDAGASAIEVSGDWHTASQRANEDEPFFSAFGARLAASLDVPVIVTGGWRSIDVIERHLASDGIAGVGMSRPLICQPDLPSRWLTGDRAPSRCIACGYCQKHPGIPCALHAAELVRP